MSYDQEQAAASETIEKIPEEKPKPPAPTFEIKTAPPGSVREGMMVGIVWRDTKGQTWIAPGSYKVKGAWANGRVNLKLKKR